MDPKRVPYFPLKLLGEDTRLEDGGKLIERLSGVLDITLSPEATSALVAYVREQQHRQALGEAVAGYRQAVTLATQLYTEGQTDFLNVLSAQRSLYAAQDALVQSERIVATDLVAIYKALGGGWETETQTTTHPRL